MYIDINNKLSCYKQHQARFLLHLISLPNNIFRLLFSIENSTLCVIMITKINHYL